MGLKSDFKQLIHDIEESYSETVEWRRHLHQHPELSFEEYETSKFIAEKLEEFGLTVHRNVGGTGVIAKIEGQSLEKPLPSGQILMHCRSKT